MKPEKTKQAPIMTKEEFDKINAAHEEMLRRDPCGTEVQRKALEALVKAWEDAMAQTEADKKKGTK
jgi:hypothetical protein